MAKGKLYVIDSQGARKIRTKPDGTRWVLFLGYELAIPDEIAGDAGGFCWVEEIWFNEPEWDDEGEVDTSMPVFTVRDFATPDTIWYVGFVDGSLDY